MDDMQREVDKIHEESMYSEEDCCSICGGDLFHDNDSGELVCTSCGYVVEDIYIDRGPDWRAFNEKEREERTRVGLPNSPLYLNTGTVISRSRKVKNGEAESQLRRMRKWNRRSMGDSKKRNLSKALPELARIADKLSIPNRESAAMIYRNAVDKGITRGREIDQLVTACLYIQCRLDDTPRMIDEFVEATRYSKKEIAGAYRALVNELDIDMSAPKLLAYIPKVGDGVGISLRTQHLAMDILETAKKYKLTGGRMPSGLAASTLYIASKLSGENTIQDDLAEAADVTTVTIRNRYKELLKSFDFEIYV